MLGSELDHELDCIHFDGAPLDHAVYVEHQSVELGERDVQLVVPVDLLPLATVIRVPHEAKHVGELGQEEKWNAEEDEDHKALAVVRTLVA